MKSRPILFSAQMVRALLDGSKTQTRREVKLPADRGEWETSTIGGDGITFSNGTPAPETACIWNTTTGKTLVSPRGQHGDRLWVRENFKPIYPQDPTYNGGQPIEYDYAATYKHGNRLGDSLGIKPKWKPSIHMPRVASRITLEITGVRVERLQDISEADAAAEGIASITHGVQPTMWRDYSRPVDGAGGHWFPESSVHNAKILSYRSLWESLNGPGSWAENPWVWVLEVKRITA